LVVQQATIKQLSRGNVYFAPLSSTALSNLIPIAALTQSVQRSKVD